LTVVQSHAWGIADSAFLEGLLIACVAHVAAVVILRLLSAHPLRRGPHRDRSVSVYELAALTDGAMGVVTTAATALHQARDIAVEAGGPIVARAAPADDRPPIERELYRTIARTPELNAYSLPAALTRGAAIAEVAAGLQAKGLMPAPWVAAALRWLTWIAWAYGVIAFARMIAVSLETDGPLSPATGVALGVGLLLPTAVRMAGGRRSMPVTRLGRLTLERHRQRHSHLQTEPLAGEELALAVALFGSEPLRAAQPQLARAWGIISPDQAALERALL
jgi:uncharacterized protein (TIGR04222 family)